MKQFFLVLIALTGLMKFASGQGQSPVFFKLGGNGQGASGAAFSDKLGFTISNDLRLVTSDMTRMFISKEGNIGIGTETPSDRFSLIGNMRIDGDLILDQLKSTEERVAMIDREGKIRGGGMAQIVEAVYAKNNCDQFTKSKWVADINLLYTNCNLTKVGLGTSTPREMLDVRGSSIINGNVGIGIGIGEKYTEARLEVKGIVRVTEDIGGYIQLGAYTPSDNFGYVTSSGQKNGTGLKFQTSPASGNHGVTHMTITNEGKIGIGTENPGSFKLAVEGKAGARDFYVQSGTTWPDYVFAKDYKFLSLGETEQFINKNKHLPGMPSAKEVEEAGNFALGEIQVKHLEKTEELYLYVIELNKKVDALIKENERLQKELNSVKK